jgi:NADPH-dependent curcumin reductase CurA
LWKVNPIKVGDTVVKLPMEGNIFSKRGSSTKVDSSIPELSYYLIYGMTGLTAYFDGYLQTKAGETVVVWSSWSRGESL